METSKLVERQACSITYIRLKNIIQYRLSAKSHMDAYLQYTALYCCKRPVLENFSQFNQL